jgi:hypothetical protein
MSSVARFDTWQAANGTNVARFFGGALQVWDGAAWVSAGPPEFDFLVIGGGGGGGGTGGSGRSGGGAGGYRTSAGTSGGGASAEETLLLVPGTYRVTVGAGGAVASLGAPSWFASIQSVGGGNGTFVVNSFTANSRGFIGGSGGGGAGWGQTGAGGESVPEQGFSGGDATVGATARGAGGGGAGGAGGSGSGGVGVSSSITGSSVGRAGGGLGATGGTVSDGGGAAGTAGTVNTGGGGGHGAAGGSGVVIIKYPDTISLTIGVGLTSSTTSAGGFKVTIFTAGTDTVSF